MRALALLLLPLAVSSCTPKESVFEVDPTDHRVIEEIEAWGDYYWNVVADVSKNVLQIREEGDTDAEAWARTDHLMSRVMDHWSEIDALGSSQDIIDFLYARGLDPIAGAVEQGLADSEADKPTTGFDPVRERKAVKAGLVNARQALDEEP